MRWQLAAGVAALVVAPACYVAAAPGAVSEYEKASEGDVSNMLTFCAGGLTCAKATLSSTHQTMVQEHASMILRRRFRQFAGACIDG